MRKAHLNNLIAACALVIFTTSFVAGAFILTPQQTPDNKCLAIAMQSASR